MEISETRRGPPGRSLGRLKSLLCKLDEKTMPDIEKRYRAYKLLRELDSLTSVTMNQVAYGRLGGPEWQAACDAQRAAFNAWIEFADSLTVEAKEQDCSS